MHRTAILVLLSVVALAACASAHAFRVDGAPEYEPTDSDSVVVYTSPDSLPCDDHDRIARLEGKGDHMASEDDVFGEMREASAEHGANAVLVAGYSDASFGDWFSSDQETQARGWALRLHCED